MLADLPQRLEHVDGLTVAPPGIERKPQMPYIPFGIARVQPHGLFDTGDGLDGPAVERQRFLKHCQCIGIIGIDPQGLLECSQRVRAFARIQTDDPQRHLGGAVFGIQLHRFSSVDLRVVHCCFGGFPPM